MPRSSQGLEPTDCLLASSLGFDDRVLGMESESGSFPPLGILTLSFLEFGWSFHPFPGGSPWVWAHVVCRVHSRGGPGLGGVHGIGAVALPPVRPATPKPLELPVVPGRGPWPASQGSASWGIG